MLVDDEDSVLAIRAAAGDHQAFATLYEHHAPAVRALVFAKIGNRAIAEDLLQDVFARAFFAIPDLRDPARVRPWLMAIARNACIEEFRRDRQVSVVADDELEQLDLAPTAEDTAELNELAALVRGCVANLSRRDATVLTLVVQLGLSGTELADALGISEGAARVTLHRARRRLAEALVASALATADGGCDYLARLLDDHRYVDATLHATECRSTCRVASS